MRPEDENEAVPEGFSSDSSDDCDAFGNKKKTKEESSDLASGNIDGVEDDEIFRPSANQIDDAIFARQESLMFEKKDFDKGQMSKSFKVPSSKKLKEKSDSAQKQKKRMFGLSFYKKKAQNVDQVVNVVKADIGDIVQEK